MASSNLLCTVFTEASVNATVNTLIKSKKKLTSTNNNFTTVFQVYLGWPVYPYFSSVPAWCIYKDKTHALHVISHHFHPSLTPGPLPSTFITLHFLSGPSQTLCSTCLNHLNPVLVKTLFIAFISPPPISSAFVCLSLSITLHIHQIILIFAFFQHAHFPLPYSTQLCTQLY